MNLSTVLLILLLFFLPTATRAALLETSLMVGEVERRYLVSVPANSPPVQGWPLLLMVHGGGGNPESASTLMQMHVIGEREGFITVYVADTQDGWTVGEGADTFGLSELPYFDAVLEDLQRRHRIDRRRQFIAGHSNGGEMAQIVLTNRPNTYAGIAIVNSPVLEWTTEVSVTDIPYVMFFRGTADPLVPMEAGEVGSTGRIGISAADAIDWWKVNLQTPDSPQAQYLLPQATPDDGTSTLVSEFRPGRLGSVLRTYIIEHGGHGWPGSIGGLPVETIGVTAQDFSASEEIWGFFSNKELLEESATASLQEQLIEVESIQRRYLISSPTGAAPDSGWPVMVMLHGGGGSAESFSDQSRMHEVGEREGFITLYGDSLASGWTIGEKASSDGAPELPYVAAVLDEAGEKHPIDFDRVFISGHSNGGVMSHLAVHAMPERFAAIATVGSGLEPFMLELPPQPVLSVAVFRATADPIVPFDGGLQGGADNRVVASAAAVVDYWRDSLAISAEPTDFIDLPDGPTDDGTSTTLSVYEPGSLGAELRFYQINGGGHGWPGSTGGLPESIIGVTPQDYQASELIWEFFSDKYRSMQQSETWVIY